MESEEIETSSLVVRPIRNWAHNVHPQINHDTPAAGVMSHMYYILGSRKVLNEYSGRQIYWM